MVDHVQPRWRERGEAPRPAGGGEAPLSEGWAVPSTSLLRRPSVATRANTKGTSGSPIRSQRRYPALQRTGYLPRARPRFGGIRGDRFLPLVEHCHALGGRNVNPACW